MSSSELDDSPSVTVEYSIITDGSEDRSAAEYFTLDLSTGVISTKASLIQFGMLLCGILTVKDFI